MAFDEALAQRVRETLKGRRQLQEKRMFGGVAFLLRGNMCCGVVGSALMIRVGPESYEKVLTFKHVRPMDFTGKPLRGFVYVTPAGVASARDLNRWVMRAVECALSLPAK